MRVADWVTAWGIMGHHGGKASQTTHPNKYTLALSATIPSSNERTPVRTTILVGTGPPLSRRWSRLSPRTPTLPNPALFPSSLNLCGNVGRSGTLPTPCCGGGWGGRGPPPHPTLPPSSSRMPLMEGPPPGRRPTGSPRRPGRRSRRRGASASPSTSTAARSSLRRRARCPPHHPSGVQERTGWGRGAD